MYFPFFKNVLGESAIQELADFRPRRSSSSRTAVALVDKYIDGAGRVRIKGNSNLKASQSYPRMFLVFFQKGFEFEFMYLGLAVMDSNCCPKLS